MPRLWIAFIPFAFAAVIHVWMLAIDAQDATGPTKLMLMPFLALAVVWAAHREWTSAHTVLVTAIGLSWIGDGAGPLFPGADTVPLMLLFFAFAHVCYIWLFWRMLPVRRVPLWAGVYVVWFVTLLTVLWSDLGGLLIPVAAYGLLLAATAMGAARCHPLIAAGGALFLFADSVLAFELFRPEALPAWSSPLVMRTYCLGQALFAAGVILTVRERRAAETPAAVPAEALA
ncbi:MAG: lysoplasmalogenase family protein [Microbacterium sp.]